jgi:cellulose biosynthesis protein BcsQ
VSTRSLLPNGFECTLAFEERRHFFPDVMEIIAVHNIKGGVGKTTTAVNLAYRSAADGWPTLLWDLDPQAAASYILRREPAADGGSKNLIRGESDLESLVTSTDHPNLDLLPADFSYRRMDVHLHQRKNPATRLLKLMRPLKERYACLMLDCAPGMSLVAENVMHAADALVVPMLPSPLSVRTLEQLFEFVERKQWTGLRVLPFFSMVDRRKTLHRETMQSLRERFPSILDTEVPYGSDFERLALRRAPVESYAPASAAAEVYRALWREIDARMDDDTGTRKPATRDEPPDAREAHAG